MGPGGRIVSFVAAPVCRSTHVDRMAESFVRTRLSSMIVKPESGKWTKLTVSADWFSNVGSQNNLLLHLLREAGKSCETHVQQDVGNSSMEAAYCQELHFRAIASAGWKNSMATAADVDIRYGPGHPRNPYGPIQKMPLH